MPDLEDQLRAYGRQLEESVGRHASDRHTKESVPGTPPRWKAASHSPWFLVAAATVALAVTASLLIPGARPEGDDMTNKATGIALGICFFGATACSSGNAASPTTAAVEPPSVSAPGSSITSSVDGLPALFEGPADIEPGTYAVDVLGPTLQVTVPSGYIRVPNFNAVEGPHYAYLAFGLTTPQDTVYVWTDACDYVGKAVPIGPTVDDLVAALKAMKNMDTSDPRPIEFGDYSGVEVVVSFPADLDIRTCYGGSTSLYGDSDSFGVPGPKEPGAAITMRILDIDGKRGAINFGANTVLPADVQAELDAMVDSLQFS